jgi:predicted nucleic acid-binding Zn ribbon protein
MTWKELRRRDGDYPWREPRPVNELVGRLSARWGIGQPDVMAAVFAHWTEIVGEQVGAAATPVSLRQGVLRVDVVEAAWATELRFFSEQIIGRIAQRSGVPADDPGGVRELSVRVVRRSPTAT